MVVTKAKISENLFEKLKLTKRDSKEFVEFFFEEIRKSLEKGENVKLSGFGKFQLKNKKERPGRNPRTGESILITERRVVTFKACQKLKNRVKNCFLKIKY
ncbi:integration host factor subunit alpha [uncultured Buchnera sp.]|jgi:integration host factor subunit alpha|uniref:integration host factor subunit alpha n=1 Tax=uncultured Buchnera sp. TaxID=574037 RepID=UPI0025E232AD|nr:integration host factor subunit alpha [uncultured Buchnera sp.]